MAEPEPRLIFPPMAEVRIALRPGTRRELEAFVREKGWTLDEGVKILLGYAAAVARSAHLSPEQVSDELGAARAELAVLRHRAFTAGEAIRALRMNATGFEKSLEQFTRTIPRLEREEQALRARLQQLLDRAAQLGIDVAPEEPEPPSPRRSLVAFFRAHPGEPK